MKISNSVKKYCTSKLSNRKMWSLRTRCWNNDSDDEHLPIWFYISLKLDVLVFQEIPLFGNCFIFFRKSSKMFTYDSLSHLELSLCSNNFVFWLNLSFTKFEMNMPNIILSTANYSSNNVGIVAWCYSCWN